jgi:hypothetical protein
MKKISLILATILFLTGCGKQVGLQPVDYGLQSTADGLQADDQSAIINAQLSNSNQPVVNIEKTNNQQQTVSNINTNKTIPDPPASFDIKVAFASQAPLGDWNMPYQEACEEASMIMAARYYKGEKLDANIMNEEILKLVKWEEENGYALDLTSAEVVAILDKYFGVKSEVSKEVTAGRIKKEIAAGHLIIAPAAGRDLGNPNYRAPGPLFHMLVIRGYNPTNFITNDPGTRKGDGYQYSYGDLLWAIHDWNGGTRIYKDPRPEPEINKGEKVMVVVGV